MVAQTHVNPAQRPATVSKQEQARRKDERERARQWIRALVEVVGECYWCSKLLPLVAEASIDHLIPISKGGTSELINIVLCCRRCNTAKADRTSVGWGSRLVNWAVRFARDKEMPVNWKTVYDLVKTKPIAPNKMTIGEGIVKEMLRRPESKVAIALRERYSPTQTPFEPMMDIRHGYDKHVMKRLVRARVEGVTIRNANNRKAPEPPTIGHIWPKAS